VLFIFEKASRRWLEEVQGRYLENFQSFSPLFTKLLGMQG